MSRVAMRRLGQRLRGSTEQQQCSAFFSAPSAGHVAPSETGETGAVADVGLGA